MADELLVFLRRLGLEDEHQMLQEEAITDVELLKSMGEDMLREVDIPACLPRNMCTAVRLSAPPCRPHAAR
jgi:hypothetical protein